MNRQLTLDIPSRDVPLSAEFYGEGYDRALDMVRLSRHCQIVLDVLRRSPDRWWTYEELADAAGVPRGSVRTRVSNLKAWNHPIQTRTRPDRFREVRLGEEQHA